MKSHQTNHKLNNLVYKLSASLGYSLQLIAYLAIAIVLIITALPIIILASLTFALLFVLESLYNLAQSLKRKP